MLRNKRKTTVQPVMIRMLDGRDVEHGVQRGETVEGVIFNVAATLGVAERNVFGLAFPWEEPRDETEQATVPAPHSWVWLCNRKSLVKQLSELSENTNATAEVDDIPIVHFRFKFYPRPPLATSLREDRLRHLLRLQVERDFRDGRLDCSFTMRAYMDAYLVQAELGNYDARLHNSLDYVRVVRSLDAKFDGVEMIKWIAAHHSELDGVTAAEAELKYLSLATRLPMYGVTSYPVTSISGQQLTLNIGVDGVFLTNDLARTEQYVWHQILSLSYKRRRFRLEIRPPDVDEPANKVRASIIEFKCTSERAAKLVWLTSMDFHLFYRSKSALGATSSHSMPPASSNSPQTLKTARRLLNRTASLRRTLSARKHHYSTGHSRQSADRSQSDSQSVNEGGGQEVAGADAVGGELGDLPWRRFSEPTGPVPSQHPQPSTSTGANATVRLHHSTDSGRVFGDGSADGATASSTPGTAHRSLLSPALPCENCGWTAPWARGISPHSGSIDENAGLTTITCDFRVVRLGAAKLGWSVDSDPWCMPMVGFTNSGRRLYSITEDGREFLLEGWVIREGDRLTCSLDMRRRFASWYLNDAVLESRSDLPAALSGYGVQPTVWESEGDLEVRVSRGSQALSLLVKASSSAPHNRPEHSVGAAGRVQASRASSATSADSHIERGGSNSRHSSTERDCRLAPCGDETEEDDEEEEEEEEEEAPGPIPTEDVGRESSEPCASVELAEVSEVLEPGMHRVYLTVDSFPFVETLATRIPSGVGTSVSPEQFTTKIPYVETRRCIFQG